MKFDEVFETPVAFWPDGLYISRRLYDRDKAAQLISEEVNGCFVGAHDRAAIQPEELQEVWVRFGPAGELQEQLGSMAWMLCERGVRGAQPLWEWLP